MSRNSKTQTPTKWNRVKRYASVFLSFFLLFISSSISKVHAQLQTTFEDINVHGIEKSSQSFIGLQSNYYYGSNKVTNQFFNTLYKGGYIDSATKNNEFDRLASRNKVGGELNFSLFAKLSSDSLKNTYWFKAGGKDIAGFTFSDNTFKLIFDGNSQFAGESIDLGKTVLNSIQFQYITAGVERVVGKSQNMTVGAGVSFVKGSDNLHIKIDRAILFTQEEGEYIDLDLNYSSEQTDTAFKNFEAFNGFGAGVDLYYLINMKNKSQLNVSISDIGFMRWNTKSYLSSADTSYHFEGLEVSNVFDLLDTTSSDQNYQDTIINGFLPATERAAYTSILPAQLHLNYLHPIGGTSFYALAGLKYMFNPGYFPKVYAGGAWYTKNFDVITSVSYGGYTNLSWDLRLRKTFFKTFEIYAGCNNMLGYILPKMTSSQGAFVALNKYF